MTLPFNESTVLFQTAWRFYDYLKSGCFASKKCLLHKHEKKNQSKHKPNSSMYLTNILKMMAQGKSVVYIQSKCLSSGVK